MFREMVQEGHDFNRADTIPFMIVIPSGFSREESALGILLLFKIEAEPFNLQPRSGGIG